MPWLLTEEKKSMRYGSPVGFFRPKTGFGRARVYFWAPFLNLIEFGSISSAFHTPKITKKEVSVGFFHSKTDEETQEVGEMTKTKKS